MRRARAATAVALGVVLVGAWPSFAAAEDTLAFRIDDSRITESSGLARDTADGLYWTANDSGASGTAYALAADGTVRGSLNYRATPRDVEAVAVRDSRLYLADIGDNLRNRDLVTVYTFDNPQANGGTTTYHALDFRYPDGAHDAETLLVNAKGRMFVVTKGLTGAVYAAPAAPSRIGVNALTKVGSAPSIVTDGTFLPGGKQIALLTYTSVVVLDAKTYAKVASAPIPKQQQAESLAVSLDGKTLLVGSEGRRSKVYAMPIPAGASASPAPTPTPRPTASPSREGTPTPSATATTADDEPEDDTSPAGSSRRGTFLAVGLAAVVAVVAGVVVAVVRRP